MEKTLINHTLNYTSKMVKHLRDYFFNFFFNVSGLLLEFVWGEWLDVCATRVLSCKWVLMKVLCNLCDGDAVRLSLYSKKSSQVHQREHWSLREKQKCNLLGLVFNVISLSFVTLKVICDLWVLAWVLQGPQSEEQLAFWS